MNNAEYRHWLITQILNDQNELKDDPKWTQENLAKKSIRILEIIYDNLLN